MTGPIYKLSELTTVGRLAVRWGVHQNTIYGYINSGRLPYLKAGGRYRFKILDILEYEQEQNIAVLVETFHNFHRLHDTK